jgi:hypothetical protein
MNILGLGRAGVGLAKEFSKYPEYNVHMIDVGLPNKGFTRAMPKQQTAEEYEANCPQFSFLKKLKGELIFCVGGGGKISSATLAVLEQVQHCEISILYVQPDTALLTGDALLQERVTLGVLQQYARSGKFKRLYLTNNTAVEHIVGNVPITSYFETINETIVSTFHMLNVYNHSATVLDTHVGPAEPDRISTFGIVNMDTGVENLFFPLQQITEEILYYAVNSKILETEGSLMDKIRKQISLKTDSVNKVSFGVYETDYVGTQVYCLVHTKIIQEDSLTTRV